MTKVRIKKNSWRMMFDQAGVWKPHVGRDDLLSEVELDLLNRDIDKGKAAFMRQNLPTYLTEYKDEIFMDREGPCLEKRALRTALVDGLSVCVPSQDWSMILANIKLEPLRKFSDGIEYYKIHTRFYCLVLTPEQRNELIKGMEGQLEAAEAEGEIDDKRFDAACDRIDQETGGAVVFSKRLRTLDKKDLN